MKEINGLDLAENLEQDIIGHIVHCIQGPGLQSINAKVIDVRLTKKRLGGARCDRLSAWVVFFA
jgi:hypothetical protein